MPHNRLLKKYCTCDIPVLPAGLIACCSQVPRFCSSDWGAVANVFVRPGSIEFAVTPSFVSSLAKPLTNPMIPVVVAVAHARYRQARSLRAVLARAQSKFVMIRQP